MSQLPAQIVSHFNSLAAERGEAVAYSRDGEVLITRVAAIPGRAQKQGVTDGSRAVYVEGVEWIFLTTSIASILPARAGDIITIIRNSKIFRVSNNGSEGTHRASDALDTMHRIFSKESPR